MKRVKLCSVLMLILVFCYACGSEANGTVQEENLSELVTVVDEYFCVDSIGQATHALIIQNSSSKTVRVEANVTAKDAGGNIIGARSGSVDAVPSGAETCVITKVSDVLGVADFDYTLSVQEEYDYINPIMQDISFEQSLTGEKAIVTCTNNGEETGKNLHVVALFFRGEEFVYYDNNVIVEIAPGGTKSVEVYPYGVGEFIHDNAKIYIHGWR